MVQKQKQKYWNSVWRQNGASCHTDRVILDSSMMIFSEESIKNSSIVLPIHSRINMQEKINYALPWLSFCF